MIKRLLETPKPPRGTVRIDECVCDGLLKGALADMVRARKGREHAVLRQELEGAQVQFAIAAQGVTQSSLAACKGRRIKDDEVVFAFRFLGRPQKLKYVL